MDPVEESPRRNRENGEICSGADRVEMRCMVRPLKMAVLLLSVHPLFDQHLLHLHPTHMTDLPMYLPLPQLVVVFNQRGGEGRAPRLVSLVTDEPT